MTASGVRKLLKRAGESLRVSGPRWTMSLIADRVLPVNVLGRWQPQQVPAEQLREQVLAILSAWGMVDSDAATTADHVLYADLCGIEGHGVAMLSHYDRAIQHGALTVPASVEVVGEGPATALVDGGGGMGHVAADRAMRMAIAKAREQGVSAVTVRNSGHFGAAGSYVALAAAQGLLGIAATNTLEPAVVPTFGAEAVLGTNAIAFAAPSGGRAEFLLDIASSTASLGKVAARWRAGKALPAGWAVDARGRPVRSGRVAVAQRRLTPLGSTPETASHKGYGLAAMVEILAGLLPGPPRAERRVGHFFCAIDPSRFRTDGAFERDVGAFTGSLRDARPLDPERPVLVAGDPERAEHERRSREGVPLSRAVVEDLRAVADRLRVPFTL